MIILIVYGFAKNAIYTNDRAIEVQVRIPNIHGPYKRSDATGTRLRNYVEDKDLPYYPALMMDSLPTDVDVVALCSIGDSGTADFLVLGRTGASYDSTTD